MEKFLNCDDLPPAERAARYRTYAEQMQYRAERALTQELKAAYLRVADDWLKMAASLEAQYGEISVVIDPEMALLIAKAS
jgi:hypothetical protein